MTRRVEPMGNGIATPAAAGSGATTPLRDLDRWGGEPPRGGSRPLASPALDAVPSRPERDPMAAADEDVLFRLALWLAEVSAEAALAATTPGASSTPDAVAPRTASAGPTR